MQVCIILFSTHTFRLTLKQTQSAACHWPLYWLNMECITVSQYISYNNIIYIYMGFLLFSSRIDQLINMLEFLQFSENANSFLQFKFTVVLAVVQQMAQKNLIDNQHIV